MRLAIAARKKNLDDYFLRAGAKDIPEETRSDLARHGTVLICGFVERCVELIILERLSHRAHPRVIGFIKTHFKKGTNYNCEPICQLLERFDNAWAIKFRKFMTDNDNLVEALSSAYTLRNSIAHGGPANRGLSGVIELYDAASKVVEGLVKATE